MDTPTSPTRNRDPQGRSGQDTFSGRHKHGGRGSGQGKKRDMGRKEWSKTKADKRQRNDDEREVKRQRLDRGDAPLPIYATEYTQEEIDAEAKKPKRKVAVMIGYAGTGYRGMQLTHDQKTIEGDLFKAFVGAGAISKANADDPKKSSFVRCARTDKGVHAAGNVISLKLIVEDEDVVRKINEKLVPQIRVWGIERTNNGFSSYQLCDSRIYEYLIPTSSFLPPHPSSFLARQIGKWAEEKGDVEEQKARQEEVQGFWQKVDEETIEPMLKEYDKETRDILEKAVYLKGRDELKILADTSRHQQDAAATTSQEGLVVNELTDSQAVSDELVKDVNGNSPDVGQSAIEKTDMPIETAASEHANKEIEHSDNDDNDDALSLPPAAYEGIKRIRQAYIDARRAYRIPPRRLQRVKDTLAMFRGTQNFHNYTIDKTAKDPSAKRVIKSFVVDGDPILIDGTEWLSLKVHGQSFMMHQIRKMVGMVALVVRCGASPEMMKRSYTHEKISIPKAPSLGLLLERPVFESYNSRATSNLGREPIDFGRYEKEIDEFKKTEIYARIYGTEEKENIFGNFFSHIDNFPSEAFLFVTSGGIEATRKRIVTAHAPAIRDDSDDETQTAEDGEGPDR